jgi:hypothetical protein
MVGERKGNAKGGATPLIKPIKIFLHCNVTLIIIFLRQTSLFRPFPGPYASGNYVHRAALFLD